MKFLFPLFSIILLFNCANPENPPESSSSDGNEHSTAKTASPMAGSTSLIFDRTACGFLTKMEIKQTLGNQISDVSFQKPFAGQQGCKQNFMLTLPGGNRLRLLFSIEPSSLAGVEKEIKNFKEGARDIPRLIKMEMAPDGETYIGTHVSQRRLYVLRSGEETFMTLSYDVRGAAGGKTAEVLEARRQMGVSLIREILKG